MQEPPILPSEDGVPAAVETERNDNPFAPSTQTTEAVEPWTARDDLPPVYWACLAVAMLLLALVTYTSQGLTLPGLVAIVAAAIRVPLMQRRQTRKNPKIQLPHSLLFLLASWAISLLAILASGIAFVVICVPTSLLFLAGSNSGQGLSVAVTISGVIAFAAFLFVFIVSLRLPC